MDNFLSFLRGKTVLVTGATGFIGTHLVKYLCANPDLHLVLVSRKPQPYNEDGVTWVNSSLEELTPEHWKARGLKKIDLVFHLGAFIPKSSDTINSIEPIYQDNLIGTRNLLNSVSPLLPERIVFASTIDVYAPLAEGLVLTESSPLQPGSLYGASKLFCEQLVKTYAQQQGCGYTILRYGHIFGSGEEAYRKLIPQTIQRLLQGEAPVLYGDGSAERDFLYVEDAVTATVRAAASPIQNLGPVNIVRGSSSPIRNIVELLIKYTNFSGSIQYLADQSSGHSLRFDNHKMRETLGEWKLITLEDGLKREVDYFKELSQ
jgi:nucleoside-diphosphate-sugar epimerase